LFSAPKFDWLGGLSVRLYELWAVSWHTGTALLAGLFLCLLLLL
jgi:hypothetical protein